MCLVQVARVDNNSSFSCIFRFLPCHENWASKWSCLFYPRRPPCMHLVKQVVDNFHVVLVQFVRSGASDLVLPTFEQWVMGKLDKTQVVVDIGLLVTLH